ncbi:MFS transporter [Streptomyces altiplanensis]
MGAMVVYAATMAVSGLVPSAPVAAAALIGSGLAWVAVLSTLSASAQVLLPACARTRGLACYRLVFMGGQALGGVGWGIVADRFGVGTAFVTSAAGLLVTTLVGRRTLPMPAGPVDVRPAQVWAGRARCRDAGAGHRARSGHRRMAGGPGERRGVHRGDAAGGHVPTAYGCLA